MYVALCIKMSEIKVAFWHTKPLSAFVKSLFYLSAEIMKMRSLLWRSTYIKSLRILVENFSWPNYVFVTLYSINQGQDTTLVYVTIIGRSVRNQVCKTTYTVFFIFIFNPNSRHITVLLSHTSPRIPRHNSGILSWNLRFLFLAHIDIHIFVNCNWVYTRWQ